MIVVYDSLTGQTKRFVSKLGYDFVSVNEYEGEDEQVFLVTRSFNFGEIPKPTINFLEKYHSKVVGTAVSGNRNWGTNYGKAGDKIASIYQIPLVLKFEGSGFEQDILYLKKWLKDYIEKGEKY